MKVLIPLREALSDPKVLGGALVGESWAGWRALLLASVGEVLTDTERGHFQRLTGRPREPGDGVLCEAFLCIGGRRGGKSRAMSVLMAWLATCCDWSENLSLGERGRAMVVCPSMAQATLVLDYVRALFSDNELLASLVENELQDELQLKRRIIFEVVAASAAHSRGRTAIAICCDESAFLKSGDSVNSDETIVTALRPSLATTGGPLLLTSSPAGAEGLVFQLYRKHYGPEGDIRCIVAKGATTDLNPAIRRSVIDKAYEDDPDAAAAEYGAEFREPVTAYLSRELIERCIEKGTGPRRALPGVRYFAYVDVATGAGRDSFTLCIGHVVREGDRNIVVIDYLHDDKPPFDPLLVVAHLCATLKTWNIKEVMGDQAGKSLITAFARGGIRYIETPVSTSEVYMHALPSWTAGTVSLFDGIEPAVRQLAALRRKVGSGGRETIEHPKTAHAHDDLATVICGVIYLCTPIERDVAFDWDAVAQHIGVFSGSRVIPGVTDAHASSEPPHAPSRSYYRVRRAGGNGGGVCW